MMSMFASKAWPDMPLWGAKFGFWAGVIILCVSIINYFFRSKTPFQEFQSWITKQVVYGEKLKKNPNKTEIINWCENKVFIGVRYILGKKGLTEFNKWVQNKIIAYKMYSNSEPGIADMHDTIYKAIRCLEMLKKDVNPSDLLPGVDPKDLP